MTGFGDAAEQVDGVHYSVELRSLNNRYFKGVIRLPDDLTALEAELEAFLRKRFHRGSVVLSVNTSGQQASGTQRVNISVLQEYLEQFPQIRESIDAAGLGEQIQVDLGTLLNLPGVISSPDPQGLISTGRPVILRLVEAACGKLQDMRRQEGQGLVADLKQHCEQIKVAVQEVSVRAPGVVEEYHQKLKSRVEHLIARAELEMGEDDLAREVAIFAERSDIAEELQRLGAHLEQFLEILDAKSNDPSGRTLDFITQELLREANTIASKSNDAQIGRTVVQIKGAIDRIKEQVQNVE
jgi:uncharacterized protein (TIGR00255 family)